MYKSALIIEDGLHILHVFKAREQSIFNISRVWHYNYLVRIKRMNHGIIENTENSSWDILIVIGIGARHKSERKQEIQTKGRRVNV